ncbi:MAG: competence/damage-inducible protein A [Sulfuricurvum sp.]
MRALHFYVVIIGSEILNGRRIDKHFSYIRDMLLLRGHVLYASFTIKDDSQLIQNVFELIKNDPQSVLFSFGGIGSTPDDLTRQIASDVFSDGTLYPHPRFMNDILERFGDQAYPHRIFMSHLPKNADLLHNVINNMSGFYLNERYFFMPGFPEMSHPMVNEALDRFYPQGIREFRYTLLAQTGENTLIEQMKALEPSIDFSSLPMINGGSPQVEISVASRDERLAQESFKIFTDFLQKENIVFDILQNGSKR